MISTRLYQKSNIEELFKFEDLDFLKKNNKGQDAQEIAEERNDSNYEAIKDKELYLKKLLSTLSEPRTIFGKNNKKNGSTPQNSFKLNDKDISARLGDTINIATEAFSKNFGKSIKKKSGACHFEWKASSNSNIENDPNIGWGKNSNDNGSCWFDEDDHSNKWGTSNIILPVELQTDSNSDNFNQRKTSLLEEQTNKEQKSFNLPFSFIMPVLPNDLNISTRNQPENKDKSNNSNASTWNQTNTDKFNDVNASTWNQTNKDKSNDASTFKLNLQSNTDKSNDSNTSTWNQQTQINLMT